MSNGEILKVSREDAGLVVLTLSRPGAHNAMNVALRDMLAERLEAASSDETVRAVIICGDGPSFCAGSDLKEAARLDPTQRAPSWERLWSSLENCRKPTIAAVEARALGAGFELILACDLVVAGRSARFGLPEVRYGFVPAGGGASRLSRLVGKHRAMRLILASEELDAAQADALGILSILAPEGQAVREAIILARRIAGMPPLAAAAATTLIRKGLGLSLNEALRLERRTLAGIDGGAEQRTHAGAFAGHGDPLDVDAKDAAHKTHC